MVSNTIGNRQEKKGEKGINNLDEIQEYDQVGTSFWICGVLLLLAAQPGAHTPAYFVG